MKIKIQSIILHFKEGVDKRLYFQFCSGITFLDSNEANKGIWRSWQYNCELNNFIFNNAKVFYKQKDKKIMNAMKCLNCSNWTSPDNFHDLPKSFIINFYKHLEIKEKFSNVWNKDKEEMILDEIKVREFIENKSIEENKQMNKEKKEKLVVNIFLLFSIREMVLS